MGVLISFDKMTMNWLNEGTGFGQSQLYDGSSVFADGYEDPTYMTFRIEFGGWGASTSSIATFREMQRSNGHSSNEIRRVYSFNYDDYPQGLLDLNFAKGTIESGPYDAFVNQGTYNAYNWLLNRNEDNRAAYLKTFIEGIYEIQRQYPYIFQEISGLDALSEMDPKRGTRLGNDVTITLKCIEGLSRKIYTLMQCYAKAAWDAEYQRWILPENYRQFKMIIYVFERRVFHSARQWQESQQKSDESSDTKKNFGSQLVDFLLGGTSYSAYGPVSDSPTTMAVHSVNTLLPVMAYECNLCEFVINSFGGPGDVAANWNSMEPNNATIAIKVKNVRTYYKNGLLEGQLASMVIGDMVTAAERDYDPDGSDPMQPGDYAYISAYLDRSTIYQDDIGPDTRPGFGGGGAGSADPNSLKGAFDSMVNSWKNVFGIKSNGTGDSGTVPGFYAQQRDAYMQADDLTKYRNENWWSNMIVNGPPPRGSFWQKLWNVIKAGTQHVRIPPGYNASLTGMYNNILDYINYNNTLAGAYMSYATRDNNPSATDTALVKAGALSIPDGGEYKYKSAATAWSNKGEDDVENDTRLSKMTTVYDTIRAENDENTKPMDSLVDEHKNMLDDFYAQGAQIGDPNMEMGEVEDGYEYDAPDELQEELEDTDIEPQDVMTGKLEYDEYVYPNKELSGLDAGVPVPAQPVMGQLEPGIAPPPMSMDGKYEYDEYKYPSESLDSMEPGVYEPVLIGGDIDDSEGFTHEESPVYELDTVAGGIEVVDKNGDIGTLFTVERPELAGTKAGNIVLDADDTMKIISGATSQQDMQFTTIDTTFSNVEKMIGELAKDSGSLVGLEKDSLSGNITTEQMLASLAYDAESLKQEAAAHIAELQSKLKSESAEVIRSADKLEVSKALTASDLDKNFIEVPPAVVSQLEDNLALFSIPRPELGSMSLQTMVSLEKGLTDALLNTSALVEVMHMTKDKSMATDLDGGPDKSTMNEGKVSRPAPRTTKNGTDLIGE